MNIDQKFNSIADPNQEVTKVLYTAKTHTSGGRRGGISRSDDDRLDLKFGAPGVPGTGTNPEQLFAAGWSACFISAMGHVASKMKVNFHLTQPSMPKLTSAILVAPTFSKRGLTSACPAWNAKLHRPLWRPRTPRLVHTRML